MDGKAVAPPHQELGGGAAAVVVAQWWGDVRRPLPLEKAREEGAAMVRLPHFTLHEVVVVGPHRFLLLLLLRILIVIALVVLVLVDD